MNGKINYELIVWFAHGCLFSREWRILNFSRAKENQNIAMQCLLLVTIDFHSVSYFSLKYILIFIILLYFYIFYTAKRLNVCFVQKYFKIIQKEAEKRPFSYWVTQYNFLWFSAHFDAKLQKYKNFSVKINWYLRKTNLSRRS